MFSNQGLVGGHNVLAVVNRGHDQLFGHVIATDQLNHDINVRVFGDIKNVAANRGGAGITGRIVATRAHLGNNDLTTGAASNILSVFSQHVKCASAYGTQTADTNIYRFQSLLLTQ